MHEIIIMVSTVGVLLYTPVGEQSWMLINRLQIIFLHAQDSRYLCIEHSLAATS